MSERKRKYFGTDGIRGTVGQHPITPDFVMKLGWAAGRVLSAHAPGRQKVIIGKWLDANTDILIFDEPTRGIDVGAKSEIYKLLNNLAQQGKSIIMISSELPEILRMSHRIVVMCEGRITGELSSSEATQESIMRLATQRTPAVVTNASAESNA